MANDVWVAAWLLSSIAIASVVADETFALCALMCLAAARVQQEQDLVDEASIAIAKYILPLHAVVAYNLVKRFDYGKDVLVALLCVVSLMVNLNIESTTPHTIYSGAFTPNILTIFYFFTGLCIYLELNYMGKHSDAARFIVLRDKLHAVQQRLFQEYYEHGDETQLVTLEEFTNDLVPADAAMRLEQEMYGTHFMAERIVGYAHTFAEDDIEAARKAAYDSSAKLIES